MKKQVQISSNFLKYVLYEDNHLLIVNKPAGVLTQGDKTGDKPIVDYAKDYIKKKYNKPGDVYLHPVHRLDRPTSGALILARTSKGLERMQVLFKERKVVKKYWALTMRSLPDLDGELVNYLVKDTNINTTKAYGKERAGTKRAELDYKLIRNINPYFLYEITLYTGRPHQIRVQLSYKKAPIVGDIKYGFSTPNLDKSICLHSRYIEFMHPVKKEIIKITARVFTTKNWHELI